MSELPETIGRVKRVYVNPHLFDPNRIRDSVGPFHPVAAWRTALFAGAAGMDVVDAYDLVWVLSPPSSPIARVYFARMEPKAAVDYWTADVVFEQPELLDVERIEAAILEHRRLLAG